MAFALAGNTIKTSAAMALLSSFAIVSILLELSDEELSALERIFVQTFSPLGAAVFVMSFSPLTSSI